jgi:hypothetical protein
LENKNPDILQSMHDSPRLSFEAAVGQHDQTPKDERVFDCPDLQEHIERHAIADNDREIIAEIAAADTNELSLMYHNFFGPHLRAEDPQKSAVASIEASLKHHSSELASAEKTGDDSRASLCRQRTILANGMLRLTVAYGPSVALATARILEDWDPEHTQD